jgi:hypothetical protein
LLWKKEGWTQENPVTAETFAEMAMDFCSRNTFDRPPQAPRPGGTKPAGTKRPLREMTEEEQLQAAMRASIEDAIPGGDNDNNDDDDDDDDDVEIIEPGQDAKPAAEEPKKSSFFDDLLGITVGDEPASGSRLQLRMPDGKRVVRKFGASDPVSLVYAFVAVSTIASGRNNFFSPFFLLANERGCT